MQNLNWNTVSSDVPAKWVSDWETALPLDSFTLPEPNRFLTTDFNISEPENIDIDYPENIMKNNLGELWFKQDKKFNLPRAYIIFQLVSPIIFLSPEKWYKHFLIWVVSTKINISVLAWLIWWLEAWSSNWPHKFILLKLPISRTPSTHLKLALDKELVSWWLDTIKIYQ